jgi:hypothetical protein
MKPIAATVGAEGRRDFFWLGEGFSMFTSSPVRGLGFNLHFGGLFSSVPAAVAAMARLEPVIDPEPEGTDAGVGDMGGGGSKFLNQRTSVGDMGGGGSGVLTQRIDLFGLGRDYALYHKRFWGKFDQHDLSSWERFDGVFTSAPAAIAWAGGRVDVLVVGTDHAMYAKTNTGEMWTEWQRLGGAFTSAATLVSREPRQLDIFARGADFTLRGNHTDGTTWFGWQNHGGRLASPPVAVSWGPRRIDVFAIFTDGALWHRWWDGEIWNEWESLGGSYTGEPAVAAWAPGRLDVFVVGEQDRALHHHWFSNDTWSLPEKLSIGSEQGLAESPTVISTAPNQLEVFVPTKDKQIRIVKWNGQMWKSGSAGAHFRAPCRYRISVDFVRANTTRAFNADTDAAMISVAAGNVPAKIKTQWIGEIGGLGTGESTQTNLLEIEPVTVDLAEPMSFSYLVVNNGHADQDKILEALAAAGDSLSLAGSSSMQEDIAKGVLKFVEVKILAAVTLSVPVVGSILGKIESWLLGKLTAAVFKSCDGVVAVELRAMMGRDLFILTGNGTQTVTVKTQHPGTGSPTACGANSNYDVTWTIEPL